MALPVQWEMGSHWDAYKSVNEETPLSPLPRTTPLLPIRHMQMNS